MSKIIDAYPREGVIFRTKAVFQYDYGQIIRIHLNDLPASYKVEFSNSTRADAVSTVQTTDEVMIPAQFLESGSAIYAWIVIVDENSRTTEYALTVPVTVRARPTDTDPTPEEQSEIEYAIAALNAAVTVMGYDVTAATDAKNAAQAAQTAAEWAQTSAETAQAAAESAESNARGFAGSALESAQGAAASAESAAESAQSAGNSALEAGASSQEAKDARDAVMGMTATATTLSPGSSATANYANGVLTFGIPQGDQGIQGEKGDKGDTGPQGPRGVQGPKGDKGDKGDTGPQGETGATGADGVTFTPSVSAAGVISWTNDGGKPNPQSVDIVAAVLAAQPAAEGVQF